MKIRTLRRSALVMALITCLVTLDGCSLKDDNIFKIFYPETASGDKHPDNSSKEAPVPLKIFKPANVVNTSKDPIMLEIQKRTNTRIEIVTAPWDQCWNKLNLIMSSGERLDLINADGQQSPYVKWAREGMVYALDPLIDKEKHPYCYKVVHSQSFKPFLIDGKSYYVVGTHHGQDLAFYIRKDWLDKLGLKMPETLEEYYEVAKAFRDRDPDENGKDDTIACQVSMLDVDEYEYFDPFIRGYGGSAGGFFKDLTPDSNGRLIDNSITDNTKEAFKYINKLYREKLINTDFTTIKDISSANSKYLFANKAGSVWTSRVGEFEENIRKVDPNASLVPVPKPLTAEGRTLLKSQGHAYWLLVGVPKTSRNPQKAIDFLEYCNSEEGRKLLVCGIEGVHYSHLEDGVYIQDKEVWQKDFDIKNNGYDYPLWYGFFTTVHGYIPCDKYPTYEEAFEHKVIYDREEDLKLDGGWSAALENGSMYNEENLLHYVTLSDVNDEFLRIQKEVKAKYFIKMVTTTNPDEIDTFWEQYKNEYDKAGGKKWLAAYQSYYDNFLKNK